MAEDLRPSDGKLYQKFLITLTKYNRKKEKKNKTEPVF